MTYQDLPFINKVAYNRQAFGEKVIQIGEYLGIMPAWLMVVMNNESGLDSTAKNPNGTATGLIQFTEATANDLGTTTAQLRAMSNVEQLDFVKLYFKKYGYNKHINDLTDTYLAVFYPAALFKDETWKFPTWAVNANPIFDINKDGILSKAEFRQYVENKYGSAISKANLDAWEGKKKIKS